MKKNLTEKEASKVYGPSVSWFRRERWKGDGPAFVKLSGMVLYPVEELESFFASRLRKSTSDPGQAGKNIQANKQAAKVTRIGKGKAAPFGFSSPVSGQGGGEQ